MDRLARQHCLGNSNEVEFVEREVFGVCFAVGDYERRSMPCALVPHDREEFAYFVTGFFFQSSPDFGYSFLFSGLRGNLESQPKL